MTSEAWRELTQPESCPFCHQLQTEDREDAYGFPVAELPSGRLRLSRNQTRLGYCILISRSHVCELHDLSPAERTQFAEDVAKVSRAVQSLRGAAKMNVQLLGNGVPHLHAHIFPRYLTDADFGKYPEDKTTAFTELEPSSYRSLVESLCAALALADA